MNDLIEQLKVAFASTYAFYLKAQNYHWNVEGPLFPMYHEFFGDLYEEVGESIDPFAEQIRAQGAYAPGTFSRLIELSNIQEDTTVLPASDMVKSLYAVNFAVYDAIKAARDLADTYGKSGLVNFLEGRLDAHKKHEWMLKASL